MKKIFFSLLILSALTNCTPKQTELMWQGDGSSSLSFATCDEFLMYSYRQQVYPFFRSTSRCQNCHIEGGVGLGLFSSTTLETSYGAFAAAGLSKVSYMATNSQHKPPFTGPQNQVAIDQINRTWPSTQGEYLDCVSRSENGGVNESLLTSMKGAPTIYSDRRATETLVWDLDRGEDLDLSVSRSLPAQITIDVDVLYQSINNVNVAKGYVFSNPTLRMKDVNQQILIEGLFFQINGQPITSQTTFTNLSRVVSGPTAIPLMNATANTLVEPLSTADVFQLYIRRIVPTQGSDDGPQPMTPIINVLGTRTLTETIVDDNTVDITIIRDAGVLKWCLSESPTPPASSEAPCENLLTGPGFVNGWSLTRPTEFDLSAGDGPKTLYLWVSNQYLKMNTDPGIVQLRLDTTAPAAPTINSITVTDTQVAAMTVTHPDEPDIFAWCVLEQNIIAPPPNINLQNDCWNWSDGFKPTTVGFKGGGSRDVWVYVRDRVGNISAASNQRTVINAFGAITYSQLTNSSGGATAIFRNRCYTCHGTSANPGFSKLQLFNYTSALDVADSGVLVQRINNPISPMPNVNGGLMPQRERDLIRLWTMPEDSNTPLP